MPRPPFPKNLREFQRQFATEEACEQYLAACRWPEGFACRRCGNQRASPSRGGVGNVPSADTSATYVLGINCQHVTGIDHILLVGRLDSNQSSFWFATRSPASVARDPGLRWPLSKVAVTVTALTFRAFEIAAEQGLFQVLTLCFGLRSHMSRSVPESRSD